MKKAPKNCTDRNAYELSEERRFWAGATEYVAIPFSAPVLGEMNGECALEKMRALRDQQCADYFMPVRSGIFPANPWGIDEGKDRTPRAVYNPGTPRHAVRRMLAPRALLRAFTAHP